ncbi:Flp family type IVb pilin [Egicoccus sp. AB-alg6-2]|uniref:Flp family type IVb pilin n=1 Tax=Egicoccus sp. AB-alg6-2 TaxID=3242692 RepID=UPI00359DCE1A
MFITLQILRGDFVARFKDDEGATAVEYGLLVALIAAVIIGTVVTLGGQINQAFQDIVTGLGGAVGDGG